ncbi:MAG: hypothetical protein GVY19_01530 [Bacteroidetes bacterium]|jgi:hypothetical protein|nr:hypothetical protein [Bacteroidota bacterium]
MKRTIKYQTILIILVGSFTVSITFGQLDMEPKEMFLEAESYFLFEEYKDALPLYQRLLREEPDNYNVHYKIGICFLRDKFNKEKSIKYLEEAAQHVNLDFKQNSFKEKQAPFEVHFYLGDAYRVNNMLDKALESYRFFQNEMDEEIYDKKLVEERIESVKYAQKAMQKPIYYQTTNMGDYINTRFSERNAVISGDGKTLIFTRELQFYDAVFISHRQPNGQWSNPVNLTPEFGLDGNSYSTGISYNGNELFIYRNDEYDGNIYASKLVDGRWGILQKLNDNINTKFWESHASVSADGKTLVFTSNRKGGYGELDIYMSKRDEHGNWGAARNLGNVVNTPFNEESPFLSNDGKWLYFSSQGHQNMGGYDVFRSEKKTDGSWSKPENLGYPINTTHNDMFYCPYDKGFFGIYNMYDPKGYGLDDIVMVEIFSELHPRPIEMLVTLEPDRNIPDEIRERIQITIRDRQNREVKDVTRLENQEDKIKFTMPHGEYEMVIEGPGIETQSKDINLPIDHEGSTFKVKTPLLISESADKVSKRELRKAEPPVVQTNFDSLVVTKRDRVTIQFKVDKNTELTINRLNNNNTIEKKRLRITDKSFDYTFDPLPGINYIEAIAEDEQGNLTKKLVKVVYKEPQEETVPDEMDTIEYFTEVENIHEFLKSAGSEPVKMAMDEIKRFKVNEIDKIYNELSLLAKQEFFTQHEIDSLFAVYYSNKSVNQFLNEMQLGARGNLALALETTDLDSENIKTAADLLEYLRDERFESAFNDYDILHAFSVLLTNNDTAGLNDFKRVLTNAAKGNLKFAMQNISHENINIYTPLDLLTYLYDNNREHNFTHNELFDLLLELRANYDVDELYFDLLYFSDGELYNYLKTSGNRLEDFNNAQAFLQYLLNQSNVQPYQASDVIVALNKARENQVNAQLIKEILSKNAKGNLKEFILNTESETLQSLGFQGYINKILDNSANNKYSFTDVIEMLLSIIGYEDTEKFITEFQQLADQHLSDFIDQVKNQQFKSPSHFIQFLLDEADKQNYSKQDVIDTLIKLAYLNICQVVKGEQEMPQEKASQGITGLLIGVGVLIIIIVLLRRKKRRQDKNRDY